MFASIFVETQIFISNSLLSNEIIWSVFLFIPFENKIYVMNHKCFWLNNFKKKFCAEKITVEMLNVFE